MARPLQTPAPAAPICNCELMDIIKKNATDKAFIRKPALDTTFSVDRPGFEPMPLQYEPSALTTILKEAGIKVRYP